MAHVALITSSYPDGASGQEAAGSFVEDFARELSLQVRVTVVAASSTDSVRTEENLTVRRFAVPRIPLSLLKPFRAADWMPILQTLKAGHNELAKLALADCPDHLLALWALPSGYWAETIAEQYGVHFSVWALGSDIWSLGKIPFVRGKLRRVIRRADFCFADGLRLANDVEALSGTTCQFLPSTRRLPEPAETSVSSSPPYNFAFLGRWHVNKGADLLLDALSLLDDKDWQKISEVRINGGGPLSDSVGDTVGRLKSAGRPVVLGGYLDKQQAADMIGWADYLMLPSRVESIPVIFSDAMQLDTPVVATPVGDLPRLYKKYAFGVIASATSASAFADALRSALNQEVAAFESAIQSAKADFDLSAIVTRYLAETGLQTA